jgi:hypothetical protein
MTPTAYIEEGLFFYFLHGLLYMEVVVEPSVVWAARGGSGDATVLLGGRLIGVVAPDVELGLEAVEGDDAARSFWCREGGGVDRRWDDRGAASIAGGRRAVGGVGGKGEREQC